MSGICLCLESGTIFGILDQTLKTTQVLGSEHQLYLDTVEEEKLNQDQLASFNEFLQNNREAESWDVFLSYQRVQEIKKEKETKEKQEITYSGSDQKNRQYYDFGCQTRVIMHL